MLCDDVYIIQYQKYFGAFSVTQVPFNSLYHSRIRELMLEQKLLGCRFMGLTVDNPIKDPCQPRDRKVKIELKLNEDKLKKEHKDILNQLDDFNKNEVHTIGTGHWEECYQLLRGFTNSKEPFYEDCPTKDDSCPSDGIKIPMVVDMKISDFYGFSEFWYSMEEMLDQGGSYNPQEFQQIAKDLCAKDWSSIWSNFQAGKYPDADAERVETECFKSAWVAVTLHEGFKFPTTTPGHLKSAPNTVDGKVAHWTVGALLHRTRFLPLE